MNFRLKLWNIKEIGNTLTVSSIVSIVVCGKIWGKIAPGDSLYNESSSAYPVYQLLSIHIFMNFLFIKVICKHKIHLC